MKKLIIASAFILLTGIVFGQPLQKGKLVGVHIVDLVLQPDVTYNQWKDFMINKYIPKIEEASQGEWAIYLLEGIRGENKNEIGLLYIVKSEADRDKYYNDDETLTELGKEFYEKMNPILEEAKKFEKSSSTKYTDWIVQ